MILCIGPTPAAQRVMVFRKIEVDGVNRAVMTLDGFAGKSINVAKVLAALGERPVATGFVGGVRGEEMLEALASRGTETEFVRVSMPTRQCISVLDESSQTVTELVEESRAVELTDYAALKVIIQKRFPACEAVVMSGSLTPGGPVDLYQWVTEQANAAGILAIVDAQGPPLVEALKAKPGLVKPNRKELAATLQRPLVNDGDVMAAMREVRQLGARSVVVTAGKSPALALDEDHLWRIHPPVVSIVNPIGSGDAFTAALAWRLVRKEPLGEACRWAVAAGAANALSAMPGELNPGDIEHLAKKIRVDQI